MDLLKLRSSRLHAISPMALTGADRAALLAPEVVRWLPPGFQRLETDEDRAALIEGLAKDADLAVLADEAGLAVGLLILSFAVASPADRTHSTRHLGYLFAPAAWGQGYATEMLQALQSQFRGQDVMLSGGVMQENTASARALLKAGFTAGPVQDGGEVIYTWTARL